MQLLAAEICRRINGALVPPYDMRDIARELGFRVCLAHDLGGPIGVLVNHTILVLHGLDSTIEAVTIGHELAHATEEELGLHQNDSRLHEMEMDAVAVSLLMLR